MTSYSTITKLRGNSRGASILICVLVCLAISTTLVTSTVHTALRARRAMRMQHQLRQTELLLAAGVQRAAGQLRAADTYAGETWNLSPQAIPGIESSQVKIEVALAAANAQRKVRVTARLSVAPGTTIQRSYSFPVDPQLSSDKE